MPPSQHARYLRGPLRACMPGEAPTTSDDERGRQLRRPPSVELKVLLLHAINGNDVIMRVVLSNLQSGLIVGRFMPLLQRVQAFPA